MTCDCLHDIYKSKWSFKFEVILIDNNSTECNPDGFKLKFPEIILIRNRENSGFSRGNNLGIDIATGEYLLILNSDTLNLEQGVKYCVDYMDIRKHEHDLAGVGCKVLSPDGSRQNSAFDYRFGLQTTLLNNSIVSFVASKLGFGKFRNIEYVEKQHEKEHTVQAMLGAFMVLRRDVILKVKPLDPDFFMYCEELEWCYRISDNGYRLMYTPDVSITHIGGGTSSATDKKSNSTKQYFLSIMLLVFKQHGYVGLLAFNVLFVVNYLTNSLLSPFRSKSIAEGHKNMLKMTWYSLSYQWIMLKHFTPDFASSSFSFKLSDLEAAKIK